MSDSPPDNDSSQSNQDPSSIPDSLVQPVEPNPSSSESTLSESALLEKYKSEILADNGMSHEIYIRRQNQNRRRKQKTRIIAVSGFDPADFYLQATTKILIPVTLCMLCVVASVQLIYVHGPRLQGGFDNVLVYQEDQNDSTEEQLGGALINALLIVLFVITVTFIFFLLFKYKCTKLIYGWLFLSTFSLLGFFGTFYIIIFSDVLNLNVDIISFSIFIFNFAIGGIVAIFWHAPKIVNQFYLIAVSMILATNLIQLPEVTTWVLLAAIALYDIFAVLGPKGPLKLLVNEAERRNEAIPGLVYSSMLWMWIAPSLSAAAFGITPTMAWSNIDENDAVGDSTTDPTDSNDSNDPTTNSTPSTVDPQQSTTRASLSSNTQPKPSQKIRWRVIIFDGSEGQDDEGLKLGLGDFVFYSVLLGRAALFDFPTIVTCFVALLFGLVLTLYCLTIFERALPALPFSIFFGIFFYFLTSLLLSPFVHFLSPFPIYI